MADYRLSKEADRDIFGIASYTLEHWNEDQVDDYLTGLHAAFERLCLNTRLGIQSDKIRAGYLRHRYRSHMIFFKRKQRGILIVRVLHAKMDYVRHI